MNSASSMGPFVAIPLVLILVCVQQWRRAKSHFDCAECGASFKIGILAFALTQHVMGRRWVQCPKCGYSGLMELTRDK